jgi:hypothetical protein
MKIKIGADELILWLRKNGIAKDIPNDEVNGLGFRICRIIEGLGGKKVKDDIPVYWPTPGNDGNIDKYKLPKTSAQYEIDVNKISEIYKELLK